MAVVVFAIAIATQSLKTEASTNIEGSIAGDASQKAIYTSQGMSQYSAARLAAELTAIFFWLSVAWLPLWTSRNQFLYF